MRLVYSQEVLQDAISESALDGILQTVGRGWHVLIANLEAIRESRWYLNLGRRDRELVGHALMRWADHQHRPARGPHRVEIRIVRAAAGTRDLGDDRWELPADVAKHCAERPLLVFVEHQLSDGVFVEHVLRIMCPDLSQEVGEGAWKVRHGGGIPGLARLATYETRERCRHGPLARVVALLDSDARFPEDTGGAAAKSVDCGESLSEGGMPWLRLRVRSLENALPDRVLNNWGWGRNRRIGRQVQALLDLSSESRDFFPVNSGWSASDRWPPEAHALHAGASENQRTLLARGVDGIKDTNRETLRPHVLDEQHWNHVTPGDIENRLGDDAAKLVDLVLRWL